MFCHLLLGNNVGNNVGISAGRCITALPWVRPPPPSARPTHVQRHYALNGLPYNFVHHRSIVSFATRHPLSLALPLSFAHICIEP